MAFPINHPHFILPDLDADRYTQRTYVNANFLFGKKVLVGGIEGLSRFISSSHDTNALQLFGNAGG